MYEVLAVALDRDNVYRLRLVRMHVNRKTEVGGQIAADFFPVVARVVRAHHVPVLLHEEDARTLRMHSDVVYAVSDLGVGIGNVLRLQSPINRLPAFAAIVSAKCARGGDG